MTNQHPITPPPELVQQWINEEDGLTAGHIATRAAQWGADQELEACCEWIDADSTCVSASELRAARRPKPLTPRLKEQALKDLDALTADLKRMNMCLGSAAIRRALEALPDD